MPKNYYVVRKGRTPGIYYTWEECSQQVMGYKDAIYKKFTNIRDANNFIKEDHFGNPDKIAYTPPIDKNLKIAYIYVDGSFSEEHNNYSYGFVVIDDNDNIVYHANGSGGNVEAASIRNVAGELKGTMTAIRWAKKSNYNKIIIFHDYAGIEKWATGKWKAKNKYAQQYTEYVNEYNNQIEIEFIKITAHSGNCFNELADKLAKSALDNLDIRMNPKQKGNLNKAGNYFEVFLSDIKGKSDMESDISIICDSALYDKKDLIDYAKNIWKENGKSLKEIKNIGIHFNLSKKNIKVEMNSKVDSSVMVVCIKY